MNEELKSKLIEIRNKGYIDSLRNGSSGVGYTLETLLGKKEDTFPFPDYNGVEIKSYRKNPDRNIHFFSIVPDGDFLFPYERILQYVGYPDKDYPEYKVFHMDLNAKVKTRVNRITNAWLYVDRNERKVSFLASKMGRMVPINVSWSFDEILQRITTKIKRLLLVEAEFKTYNGKQRFHYTKFRYMELKKNDLFIDLIESGTISISIKLSIEKSPERLGLIKDHGCTFFIKLKDIEKLYSLKEFI